MLIFIAFALCASAFLTLVALRRRNDERGVCTPKWMRGLSILAGVGYFGFGMWLIGEIATVLP